MAASRGRVRRPYITPAIDSATKIPIKDRHRDQRDAPPHRRTHVRRQDARVHVEQVWRGDDEHGTRDVGADLQQDDRLGETQREDAPQTTSTASTE